MKKKFIFSMAIVVSAIAIMFTGCGKADTDDTPPSINVLGANPVMTVVHTAYVDAGATASDDVSSGYVAVFNDISATNPDTGTIGSYTIHYTANDGSGNTGHATRVVNVVSLRDYYIGTYRVQDSTQLVPNALFGDTVVAGTAADELKFKNFADQALNCVATVTATTISMAAQNFGTDSISATSGGLNNSSKSFTLTYFNNGVKHRSIYTKQ